jgi:GT2 family glycosyltransferase
MKMKNERIKIIALATCFNRVEKTKKSIFYLQQQVLKKNIELEIVLVDDGSKDGTSEAISRLYPQVKVIKGGGDLYWAGGMLYGWEQYVKFQKFNFLLVFNDDINIKDNALQTLITEYKSLAEINPSKELIIAGALSVDNKYKLTSYGGFRSKYAWHPLKFELITPNGSNQEIDTFNLNFALIPASVTDKIGFFEGYFKHSMADLEYGLRLKKNKGMNFLSANYVGFDDRNPEKGTSQDKSLGLIKRVKLFYSVKEGPFFIRLKFFKSYGGILWPVLIMAPLVRLLTEALVRKK